MTTQERDVPPITDVELSHAVQTDACVLFTGDHETAEALAEYLHKKMREELGIAGEDSPHIRDLFHQKYRGSRYSFGYPACPNLEDQTKLFALLHPEENIGVRLTTGFLLDPEQSTSAIVVHHPGAKYFVV